MILDTNVVSELMRPQPNLQLVTWIDRQRRRSLCTTSITVAEIYFGLRIMPAGRRRNLLLEQAEEMFREDFEGRIIEFDDEAAKAYADLAANRRAIGRPIGLADGYIAAIARSRALAIVTRNTSDFEGLGLEIIDPFATT